MPYSDLRKGRRSIAHQEYLITTVCLDRRPVFSTEANTAAFSEQIHQDPHWLAWVLMPDHFHGLLRLSEGESLSEIVRALKGRTAREIADLHWQPNFYDHALRAEEDRLAIARYLLGNPIRAGIVSSLREYPHWGCQWFTPGDDPDGLDDR
ncbi:MAG: transposase [Halofilum sp. (in: g-proteobacteria)]